MSRLLLGTGMVAAAWTLAITGLVFIGDAEADAAWAKTGPGTASAKAIRLVAPDQPTVIGKTCTGNNYSISLSWTYNGDSGATYEVFAKANNGNSALIATTTAHSASVGNLSAKPSSVSVRATAGNWRGTFSPEVSGC